MVASGPSGERSERHQEEERDAARPLSCYARDPMRKTRRTSQVGATIRDALVEVFRHDLKDARLALVSITEVEVSPDLHVARVFISGLNAEEAQKISSDLNAQQGRVRHFLGQRAKSCEKITIHQIDELRLVFRVDLES